MKKIIIVEDSSIHASTLISILESNNNEIIHYKNGLDVLKNIENDKPDLIISDTLMPIMDGYELCNMIKKNENLNHIPFIILTSFHNIEDIINCVECKANGFIVKPYKIDLIQKQIENILISQKNKIEIVNSNETFITINEINYKINSNPIRILNFIITMYNDINSNGGLTPKPDEEINKKYSTLKSILLSNISHNIRTPLNSIIGFSKLLSSQFNTEQDTEKYINIIEKQSYSLIDKINKIIDISEIESKDIIIKSNKCILLDIIKELYNTNITLIKSINKNIELIIDEELSNIILYTDGFRLIQILNNFISNSIKFTDNGYIKIGYYIKEKNVVFYVKDTGIGIHKKYFKDIFKKFNQIKLNNIYCECGEETFNGSELCGLGLGLSINKNLINLLNGEIWLESKINEGTTFYFTIPNN